MGSMWEEAEVDVPISLLFRLPSMFAASQVEASNPLVAYLCRLHGLRKAERLDPTSSGRGVPQFKTALRQRLDRDDSRTLEGRVHSSDAREILCFYRDYKSQYEYEQAAFRPAGATAKDDLDRKEQLIIMRGTVNALSEVLNGLLSDQEHQLTKTDRTREAVTGLRRRRRGSQEHVVARRTGKLGGGGSKPKQS